MDHTSFYGRGPHNEQELKELSTSHLCNILEALFSVYEQHTYLDDESLLFGGLAVATAKHLGVDDFVLIWLETFPSNRRLEQSAAFLNGYWPAAALAPELAQIRRLTQVLNQFTSYNSGWRYAADTLLRTYQRSDLPPEIRQYLRPILKKLCDELAMTRVHPLLLKKFRSTLGINIFYHAIFSLVKRGF